MSSDPRGKNGLDEGFTAWIPDVMFSESAKNRASRLQETQSQGEEPELRGDRWFSEVEEKAREEGYAAGFSRGLQEGREEMAGLRESLLSWAEGVSGALEKSLLDRLDPLSEVVLEIVSRLVGDRLKTAEGVRGLVEMAIRRRTSELSGTLLVSPEMESMIDRLDPEFKNELSARHVTIEPSPLMALAQISFRTEFHSASVDPLSAIRDLEMILREGLVK